MSAPRPALYDLGALFPSPSLSFPPVNGACKNLNLTNSIQWGDMLTKIKGAHESFESPGVHPSTPAEVMAQADGGKAGVRRWCRGKLASFMRKLKLVPCLNHLQRWVPRGLKASVGKIKQEH